MNKMLMKVCIAAAALTGVTAGAVSAACYMCETDPNDPAWSSCVYHGSTDTWDTCTLGQTVQCGADCGGTGDPIVGIE